MFSHFINKLPRKLFIFVLILIILLVITIFAFKPENSFKNKNKNNSKTKSESTNVLVTNQAGQNQNTPAGFEKSLHSPNSSKTSSPTPTSSPSPKPQTTQPNNDLTPQPITALKVNFNPNFSIFLDNFQSGAASAVTLELGSSSGNWEGMGIKILIPAGWKITEGLSQATQVGEGTIDGQQSSSTFSIYNLIDTQNHKAVWQVKFVNKQYGEKNLFLDGSKEAGYSLTLDGSVGLPISSPVLAKFRIFSNAISNPQASGVFNWKVEYLFADGILELKKEIEIK